MTREQIKKVFGKVAIILLTIFLTVTFLRVADFFGSSPYVICTSWSQDIGCGVGIVNGEVPGYRMSAHRIGLTIMPKYTDYANTSDTLELYVFNGGQQVSEKNFSFAWNGNTVTVTISSAEQPNMIYEITFWEDGVYSVKRSFDLGTGLLPSQGPRRGG